MLRSRAIQGERWLRVSGLAVVVMLSACGTTLELTGDVPGGANAGGELGTVTTPGGGTTEAPLDAAENETFPAESGPGSDGESDRRGAAVNSPGSEVSPTEGQPLPSEGPREEPRVGHLASGRGMDDTTIRLGVGVLGEYQDTADAFGLQVGYGSPRLHAQAVIDYLNERGGIAGRQIVPVFHEWEAGDSARPERWPANHQQACSRWTEDNEVFAVLEQQARLVDQLVECLARRDTILIMNGIGYIGDRQLFDAFPGYYYAPGVINMSRMTENLVDSLVRARFFGADAKVGLVMRDMPSFARAADQHLKPRLERHGLKVDEEVRVGNEPLSEGVNKLQSAVLRFRAAGVTNVLFLDTGGGLVHFFMQAAEAQQYRPRYGISSGNDPVFHQNNTGANQLRGSMGLGWAPALDVDPPHQPRASASRQLCESIMQEAGVQAGGSAYVSAGNYCDKFFFLKEALERASSADAPGLARAVAQLGRSYQSPVSFGTEFHSGRHDGVSHARVFAYNNGCNCYQYATPLGPVE